MNTIRNTAATKFEIYSHFCAKEACILHVRPGDSGVSGEGNWARLNDSITVGRILVNGEMLCDFCATGHPITTSK